jgi:hypothetical protein
MCKRCGKQIGPMHGIASSRRAAAPTQWRRASKQVNAYRFGWIQFLGIWTEGVEGVARLPRFRQPEFHTSALDEPG